MTHFIFEKKCNISNGYIAKQLKGKGSIGSQILIRIFEVFPELNPEWLLFGTGEMLKTPDGFLEKQVDPALLYSRELHMEQMERSLRCLALVLVEKDRRIGALEEQLNNTHPEE